MPPTTPAPSRSRARIEPALVPTQRIAHAILMLRGRKSMLDSDLAALYQVPIKVLNQAVKRNRARFPSDFMFQLTARERDFLRSQIVTLKTRRGHHRKYLPYAFTEQGVAMLSSVLRSARAVRVNIEIMRVFVQLRQTTPSNAELAERIGALEHKHDARFKIVFRAIRDLMARPRVAARRIGFSASSRTSGS